MNLAYPTLWPLRRWFSENSRSLTRLGIIAFVLVASYLVGPRASMPLLALPFLMGGVVLFLRWPALGLPALIVASLMGPFDIGTGSQTSINSAVLMVAFLLGLWLLDMIAKRRQIYLLPSRTMTPLIAFVAVAILSFGFGQLPWFLFAQNAPLRAQIGGLAIFILAAGTFLLAANTLKDIVWLKRITWLYLFLGGLYLAGRILPPIGIITNQLFQSRADGSLFWVWLVSLAVSQVLFNRRLDPRARLLIVALVMANAYVSFVDLRYWKSGWIPSLVAIVAILWAGAPRFGLVATIVAGIITITSVPTIYGFIVGTESYSIITRIEAWRIIAEIVKVNPILGLGPSNYYWYTPLFPILGWYVRFNSHNNYVDIIAQTGLLGLLFFLWFVYECGRIGWRLRHQIGDGFERAFAIGALGGLAGTLASGMLGDWILPFVYNVGLSGFRSSILGWLFLGALIALDQINKTRAAETAPADSLSGRG